MQAAATDDANDGDIACVFGAYFASATILFASHRHRLSDRIRVVGAANGDTDSQPDSQ